MEKAGLYDKLQGELIVSCQAESESPLHGPEFMSAMAQAAFDGGAAGIRAEGAEDLRAIKSRLDLPLVGIIKKHGYGTEVYITPSVNEVEELIRIGVDVVAFDATDRPRPRDSSLNEIIELIGREEAISMADVSNYREGIRAAKIGVDMVATTLAGYTNYTAEMSGPQLKLVERLAADIDIPVIAEGKIRKPETARRAVELGAHAVVVGSAITRPHEITRTFVSEIRSKKSREKKIGHDS